MNLRTLDGCNSGHHSAFLSSDTADSATNHLLTPLLALVCLD